jgi:hypothetical protein
MNKREKKHFENKYFLRLNLEKNNYDKNHLPSVILG